MITKILLGIGIILLTLILMIVCLEVISWIEDKFNGIL